MLKSYPVECIDTWMPRQVRLQGSMCYGIHFLTFLQHTFMGVQEKKEISYNRSYKPWKSMFCQRLMERASGKTLISSQHKE